MRASEEGQSRRGGVPGASGRDGGPPLTYGSG